MTRFNFVCVFVIAACLDVVLTADDTDEDYQELNIKERPVGRSYSLTTCDYTNQIGYTCVTCSRALHCYIGNVAILVDCYGLFRYCRNGRCSRYQGEKCTDNKATTPGPFNTTIQTVTNAAPSSEATTKMLTDVTETATAAVTVTETAATVAATVTEAAAPVAATVTEAAAPVAATVTETAAPVAATVTETAATVAATVTETAAPVAASVSETAASLAATVTESVTTPSDGKSTTKSDSTSNTQFDDKVTFKGDESTTVAVDLSSNVV